MALEFADAGDHNVGTLVVAGSGVEHLSVGAGGTGGGGSETALAVVGAVLALAVVGVGSNGADGEALVVEEVSAAALAGKALAGVVHASGAGGVAFDAGC